MAPLLFQGANPNLHNYKGLTFKNDFFMNLDVNIYHLETNTLPDINDYLIGND